MQNLSIKTAFNGVTIAILHKSKLNKNKED